MSGGSASSEVKLRGRIHAWGRLPFGLTRSLKFPSEDGPHFLQYSFLTSFTFRIRLPTTFLQFAQSIR